METNSSINLGEDPELMAGKNKKFVPVVIAVFGLFLFGLTFYGFGLFDKNEKEPAQSSAQIAVEKPKMKELKEKDINFEQNGKIAMLSESSFENYQAVAGEAPNEKQQTNEFLKPDDFDEIRKSDINTRPLTRKGRVNRKTQAQIELANRQNRRLMRNDTYLYQQTQAEAEEARREQADRLANERQQNLILDQLEKANAMQSQSFTPVAIEKAEEKKQKKQSKKSIERLEKPESDVAIAPVIGNNTTAQFWSKQTGFYNLNSKVSMQSYSENRGILAVIHGDADGITITSGQELKIRLLEPLRIIEQNENITLPIGTLIPCVAKIATDRLFLEIEGIFWQNKLLPVQISVYDIDGREGINVPALVNNQQTNRLINNLSNPIAGGQIFMPTGTVGQQVGTSLAMNLAQNALQTGTQILRRRTRI